MVQTGNDNMFINMNEKFMIVNILLSVSGMKMFINIHINDFLINDNKYNLNYLIKEQTAVTAVEDAGHVVGVEEEAVLLPAQVGERRVGAEVAVEAGGLAERQVALLRRVHHLRLVCAHATTTLYRGMFTCSAARMSSQHSVGIKINE